MTLETKIAKKSEKLNNGIIDYDRFNQYAITHHSTAIESSTFSLIETSTFLEHLCLVS